MRSMEVPFTDLVGKTLTNIDGKVGDEVIVFITDQGDEYQMFHDQDCCEYVTVEDICGDFDDLIGSVIVQAEESRSDSHPDGFKPDYEPDSYTWTFYRISTNKGSVVIRWYGTSNGYYSEDVLFIKKQSSIFEKKQSSAL